MYEPWKLEEFVKNCKNCDSEFWSKKLLSEFNIHSNTPEHTYLEKYLENLESLGYFLSQEWENDPAVDLVYEQYNKIYDKLKGLSNLSKITERIQKKIDKRRTQLYNLNNTIKQYKDHYMELGISKILEALQLRKSLDIPFNIIEVKEIPFGTEYINFDLIIIKNKKAYLYRDHEFIPIPLGDIKKLKAILHKYLLIEPNLDVYYPDLKEHFF